MPAKSLLPCKGLLDVDLLWRLGHGYLCRPLFSGPRREQHSQGWNPAGGTREHGLFNQQPVLRVHVDRAAWDPLVKGTESRTKAFELHPLEQCPSHLTVHPDQLGI